MCALHWRDFRVADRCERRPRGPGSRPRRPATANQANRPTPEKPELCSCYFPQAATQTEVCYYERRRAARASAKRVVAAARELGPGAAAGRTHYECKPHAANKIEATAIIQARLAPRRDHAPDLLQRLVDDAARGSSSGLLPHALQSSLRVPREHRPSRRDAGVSESRSDRVVST